VLGPALGAPSGVVPGARSGVVPGVVGCAEPVVPVDDPAGAVPEPVGEPVEDGVVPLGAECDVAEAAAVLPIPVPVAEIAVPGPPVAVPELDPGVPAAGEIAAPADRPVSAGSVAGPSVSGAGSDNDEGSPVVGNGGTVTWRRPVVGRATPVAVTVGVLVALEVMVGNSARPDARWPPEAGGPETDDTVSRLPPT